MSFAKIKELPLDDRPREKLMAKGVGALTESELLAILIRTGTKEKSALDISRELLADDGLRRSLVRARDVNELAKTKGIGKVKAITIIAALELGRRVSSAEALIQGKITSPEAGVELLMPRLRYESKEYFLVVLLSSKNKVIQLEQISEGSLNSSVVHPREVFAPAILNHAAAILAAHNHPSGDPTPSIEDKNLTETLKRVGEDLGIPLLDHIIIGDGSYFSFKEHKYL